MASTKNTLTFSQLRVGVFVLFGLAVLAFMVLNSSGNFNPFEKKLLLKARFAAADGLRDGNEVQLAGVRIGKVKEVILLPPDSPEEFKVEAVLAIDNTLNGKPVAERIRTDSVAQLVATSILANDKTINISLGTANGTAVTENSVLNSSEAVSINKLTETGNKVLTQIDKLAIPANEILAKANQGEGTLGQLINNDQLYKNLDTAVAETRLTVVKLQTTLDKVNNGNGSAGKLLNDPELYNSLNRTVEELEGISKDLRSGRGTAGKLLTDEALYDDTRSAIKELRDTVRSLQPAFDSLNNITTRLNDGKGTAGKLLKDEALYNDARETLVKFNSTAEKLDRLIGDAQNGKGTIGKLITDETLYNNINQTASNVNQLSSEGTKLIYDFRQNPKKFLRIKLSLF